MRASGPPPPRFNRYHAYLIAGVLVLAPIIATRRLRSACGHALHGWGSMRLCTNSEAWHWLVSTGGSWEVWLRAALAIVLLGGVVYSAFK
jgi:hypothetical protein